MDGDFAYVTDYDALHVINVSDPASPTPTGLYAPASFFSSELAVQDDMAFVTRAGEGLAIIDVSIPSNPTEVDFLNTPGTAFNVSLEGGRVYVCDGNAGLRIFGDCEITTPGDLDGDGNVGPFDLAILLGNWGPCPVDPAKSCDADIDGDGTVGAADLAILLGNWG